MKLFCDFIHFPWDQKWQDYKVEEDFFFVREQYTRVPLLYLEVEELYEKGGRYRFDMCICLHCSIQKESWNKMSFVSEEPIKRFKKVVFQICHEKKLFYSIQFKEKTFYSSIRLTFWRSKDKFYVTWFLTSCMSLLSLFECCCSLPTSWCIVPFPSMRLHPWVYSNAQRYHGLGHLSKMR